tara:strand:- start:3021 stop:5648 length:2628 start_codon:yes stop_codon:yes gene_type:complete
MAKEINKIYNPTDVEEKWYTQWEKSNAFIPESDNKSDSFTVMIPPPNVTGILHIGHMLNNTIQDVLVRRARMMSKNTLWLPGTDHASIATESKVTKMLSDKGIDKYDIGRDEFLKHSMEWKEKYGGTILKQLKKMGASCDWSRTAFTMDPNYNKAVLEAFVKLYNDNLIYRGKRMVNWDPSGLTAVSDEEVIYKETNGKLWYFKYPIKDSNDYLTVATTRPETMLGDTGVAVNPNDKRYKKLIGKTILLPIVNREIPIFGDEYVDMEFGTGCVKVTPAHDPNDFEMGQRNNLEVINIMNENASLNDKVPKSYQNLDRYDARKAVIKELEKLNLLEKIEDYIHQVGHSERTNAVIEPYISEQWFLKMESLAKPALKAVKDGEINFHPKRWTKTYDYWLENIKDWCISRQLWWGHRIPVWYKNDEIYCGLEAPDGEGWIQDEDVLDTWFSSWLWPFATLGWPEKTNDLKQFYPTQDLATGPDIIFFWVARMIMAGYYFIGEKPFSNVYFNGIIRDSQGRKMSKSLGNSPDPVELINKYGADALRVGLLVIAPQGLDILFSEDKVEHGRNFMNKLWNSARFILLNIDDTEVADLDSIKYNDLDITDKWILSSLNKTIQKVDSAYDNYKMNDAVKEVYNFVYNDFCDWYLEFSKSRLYGKDDGDCKKNLVVATHVLKTILKLLHPYTPFITEEIWSNIKKDNDTELITSSWPIADINLINNEIESNVHLIMDIIKKIRNIKVTLAISPTKPITLVLRGNIEQIGILEKNTNLLERLVKIDKVESGENIDKPAQSATGVTKNLEFFIPLKGLIDLNKEIERLQKQVNDMEGRLRAVNKKLNNESFINRAPKQVVEHEQKKQADYQNNLEKLLENLNSLIS